jgi:uncharacterized protein YifN (PemK superfamily)
LTDIRIQIYLKNLLNIRFIHELQVINLALKFHPKLGSIVICDYRTGFMPPEMVKERLAIVVSPRLPNRADLCTVVPLSQTPPHKNIRYQCKVELPVDPPPPFNGQAKWAKADMLATVGLSRLTLPYTGRDAVTGRRKYLDIVIEPAEMEKVRAAMRNALDL